MTPQHPSSGLAILNRIEAERMREQHQARANYIAAATAANEAHAADEAAHHAAAAFLDLKQHYYAAIYDSFEHRDCARCNTIAGLLREAGGEQ